MKQMITVQTQVYQKRIVIETKLTLMQHIREPTNAKQCIPRLSPKHMSIISICRILMTTAPNAVHMTTVPASPTALEHSKALLSNRTSLSPLVGTWKTMTITSVKSVMNLNKVKNMKIWVNNNQHMNVSYTKTRRFSIRFLGVSLWEEIPLYVFECL